MLVLDVGRRKAGSSLASSDHTNESGSIYTSDISGYILADSSLSRLASAETTKGWQFSLCLADIRLKHSTLKSSDLFTDK